MTKSLEKLVDSLISNYSEYINLFLKEKGIATKDTPSSVIADIIYEGAQKKQEE